MHELIRLGGIMADRKKQSKSAGKKKARVQKKPLKELKTTELSFKAVPDKNSEDKSLYIVGIGASAGGLEAFGQFFNHMPADSGMAFVLVPHLDPTHKSIIGELLSKYTRMKIAQAKDGMKVQQNNVYIIPPDKNIAILNGTLQLIEPAERRGLRHPVDFFFRSLAEDQRDKAIGIIFSGTGTEGTLGLKSVKGEGGLMIVQDPKTAKYDGMPQSAISTGLVDYILPVDKIPEQLMKFTRRSAKSRLQKPITIKPKLPDSLQKIFILIRNQTGHDFSLYKMNTIVRRIERRIALHQIDHISSYVTYLRDNPSEVDILFKELLIRVTNFFPQAKSPTLWQLNFTSI
jgi:two-component system CheB/CheR fusion protein